MISSPLLNEKYTPIVKDYHKYLEREVEET